MSNYYIVGQYKGLECEVIDEAGTIKEARRLLNEYKRAFDYNWRLWIATNRIRAYIQHKI